MRRSTKHYTLSKAILICTKFCSQQLLISGLWVRASSPAPNKIKNYVFYFVWTFTDLHVLALFPLTLENSYNPIPNKKTPNNFFNKPEGIDVAMQAPIMAPITPQNMITNASLTSTLLFFVCINRAAIAVGMKYNKLTD